MSNCKCEAIHEYGHESGCERLKNDNKITPPEIMKKALSHPLDYKELTFKDFIIIQEKAQEVANNIGYPVYLVGSALVKHLPRDIDIAIIIPYDDYIKKYTKGVYDVNKHDPWAAYHTNAFYTEYKSIKPLHSLNFGDYKIDLKICPDNWWTEKEKVILARPLKEVTK